MNIFSFHNKSSLFQCLGSQFFLSYSQKREQKLDYILDLNTFQVACKDNFYNTLLLNKSHCNEVIHQITTDHKGCFGSTSDQRHK